MQNNYTLSLLNNLFRNWSGHNAESIVKLQESGSNREYYRLSTQNISAIGVINDDFAENTAFVEFSRHFKNKGINVPEIYLTNLSNNIYLIEDLGNITLYDYIEQIKKNTGFSDILVKTYKNVLTELQKIQIDAGKGLNYNLCFPRSAFDRQSMIWDLSYFKYYFLKLANISFHEQQLENDFNTLIDYLLDTDTDFFMFRDFQSRNVMLNNNNNICFIDYQGGRKGALQYDIASLLYDAKADIPQDIREKLLDFYIDKLNKNYFRVDKKLFTEKYYGYVLIRIMQAMGAFGYRGFFERKTHFLQSIPYALKNLQYIIYNVKLPINIPHLYKCFNDIVASDKLQKIGIAKKNESNFTVVISSFSYKKGIPEDTSKNGGGFVFDCRAIHNPGRYNKYKNMTGLDYDVIDFFETKTNIHDFLHNVFEIVENSVYTYIERNFTNLAVNFGCTGGQHRSVYAAEQLAKYLNNKFKINIVLNHIEQNISKQIKKDN
jgi:aminoglycoside/choline kinase family phosphotransferase